MMKGLTEIVFILDRSGSMQPLQKDTIGGFNAMLEKQKRLDGDALVSTVLFDNETSVLHDRIDIRRVSPMTRHDYVPGGMTALADAVGSAIRHIRRVQHASPDAIRPERTLFVITTDGMENASRKYTIESVRRLINEQKERDGWEFLFLGANIDAVETARSFGIDESRAANYHPDAQGTERFYEAAGCAIESVRSCGGIDHNWKETVDRDYQSRKR